MVNKILNCAPSDPKGTDWVLLEYAEASSLPSEFSREDIYSAVTNQGSIGSCVGHAVSNTVNDREDFKNLDLSAMWVYKTAKKYDYWAGEDYSGTSISGAYEGMRKEGVCLEQFFPYNMNTENVEPLDGASDDAATRKLKGYFYIPWEDTKAIKNMLLNESLSASLNLYNAFYDANDSGVVTAEGYFDSKPVGGHAMRLVGYKETEGVLYWRFENSWGVRWGDKGYVWVPDEVVQKSNIGGVYYGVWEGEIKRNIYYGKKKDKRALPIKWIHGFLNALLKLFGQKPKFGPESKKK